MLRIRQEQFDAMVSAKWDEFYERVHVRLRTEQSEIVKDKSDAELRRLFVSSVVRSQAFGMETECQIMCMTEASVLLGDRFEERAENAWALKILRSRSLSEDQRAALVFLAAGRLRNQQTAMENNSQR